MQHNPSIFLPALVTYTELKLGLQIRLCKPPLTLFTCHLLIWQGRSYKWYSETQSEGFGVRTLILHMYHNSAKL